MLPTPTEAHRSTGLKIANEKWVTRGQEADAIAEALAVEFQVAQKGWRRLLALRHGCSVADMHWDDGEMQCQFCQIDFKRDSFVEIEARWRETGAAKLRSFFRVAPDEATHQCSVVNCGEFWRTPDGPSINDVFFPIKPWGDIGECRRHSTSMLVPIERKAK